MVLDLLTQRVLYCAAMSELEPPLEIVDPKNKERAEFMLDVVAKPGFNEYNDVRHTSTRLTHSNLLTTIPMILRCVWTLCVCVCVCVCVCRSSLIV